MDTKKAINNINGIYAQVEGEFCCSAKERKEFEKEKDEIITLLMRGSAFEKMFRQVEDMYGSSLTWDIEQKYFPNEVVK